ncbi:glycine cleavage system protein T [Labrys miyagiensis]|uniref:Glycine cleavage system protein T n=1 Tax=Labrys miyagiensis TaxID=346912 RepID=A0ABQ6CGD9_9HYPH|nr:FAD-dependent oxidoreductase [Labrys miyagiensis]GLS17759.1 glycine cleavage system protein T [Labrys miyagiensis]
MKSHTRVLVIGGGVVGCSVLYHLAKAGWTDITLIERAELTAGSTWHAAGGFHTLNGDPNVAKLQQYTVELYREIEALSGQSCGLHLTGGVMLAGTKERMDWLKMAHAKGRYLGMHTEIISAAEAKKLMPLIDEKQFAGAMYDPLEGHLDPYGTTHAYAKSAKLKGADIVLRNRVVDMSQREDGTWDVATEQGNIHAEHVVNCGGLWARECGRMVGLELPVLAMEHMYFLTEDMPEVAEINASTGKEVITALDFEGEIYMRQERGGMLLGTYEQACKPWSERETPWDFGQNLLEPDLDRIAPSLEVGFRHFPAFENAGIRRVINGPFTFAPDGNPLVGPIRGLRNYWVACGVMAGFSQGGGVGLALSNWMVHGDPGFDVWGMDVARYGDWTTLTHTNAKVRENYARRFRIRFPNEELPAARPFRTTPVYDRLIDHNAVFGDMCGLEHALWFAPSKAEAKDDFSFSRSNDFPHIAAESAAVREGVGLLEISNFAKYEISGKGADAWLDKLLPNRLPARGRMVLTPMLNENGMLIGDFTLAREADDRFWVFGSGLAEQYHMRWFQAHLPDSGVTLRAHGLDLVGLQIAGPKSRELITRLVHEDLSKEAFPFMAFGRFNVGIIPAIVGRVTYTGDLGYELWVKPEHQRALFDFLMKEGADLGLKLFGGRALNSLRLEKSFGSWSREYRPIYTPWEAGLERFVSTQKPDFIGRDAMLKARDAGPVRKLATFVVDALDADVIGDEPIWRDGKVVGWVTSGGYAHHSKASVALGYVEAAAFDAGAPYEIEIIGERRGAKMAAEPLFDPKGLRMRG